MANAVTASGEEGDPTSRYQNPRYSGKGVPDRGDDPKRKIDMTKPCNDCGMIHVDPNFNYKTHSSQTKMSKTIGNALFKGI